MVTIQFDLEFQWRRFIQNYEPIQATVKELAEHKRYFMSGMDQMFYLIIYDLAQIEDEKSKKLFLTKLLKQSADYWKSEQEICDREIKRGRISQK